MSAAHRRHGGHGGHNGHGGHGAPADPRGASYGEGGPYDLPGRREWADVGHGPHGPYGAAGPAAWEGGGAPDPMGKTRTGPWGRAAGWVGGHPAAALALILVLSLVLVVVLVMGRGRPGRPGAGRSPERAVGGRKAAAPPAPPEPRAASAPAAPKDGGDPETDRLIASINAKQGL